VGVAAFEKFDEMFRQGFLFFHVCVPSPRL
jgi:hypothetical protein